MPFLPIARLVVNWDVIVIGSGLAARYAAAEASRHGKRALVVVHREDCSPAGRGAVSPSHQAREVVAQHLAAWSTVKAGDSFVQLRALRSALHEHLREVSHHLADSAVPWPVSPGMEFVHGSAVFEAATRVRIAGHGVYEAPLVVVATDSSARRSRRFDYDDQIVLDGDAAFDVAEVPRSMVVLGADIQGCELACLFGVLGTKVTVVDRRSRSLPYIDRDLLEVLHSAMQDLGIDLVLGEELAGVRVRRSGKLGFAEIELASGRREVCDRLAIVGGRVPNVKGLQLERAGVEVDERGFVTTDEWGRTSQPGVVAAGGVIAGIGHRAEAHQGRAALRAGLGLQDEFPQVAPLSVRTIPEIAMAGLTSEMCRRLGVEHVVGSVQYSELVWGDTRREPLGLLKLVFSRPGEKLLGVQIVGPCANELIHVGAFLVTSGARIQELANAVVDVPCLSEAYCVAAQRALCRFPPSAKDAMREGESAPCLDRF